MTKTMQIPLSQGRFAQVDARFYSTLIVMGKWSYVRKGTNSYAVCSVVSGRKKRLYIHQAIWALARKIVPDGYQIDHRDQNGLNNCLSNLRTATISQQRRNRRKRLGTSSQYKGVSWSKQRQKWLAYIGTGKARRYLGLFNNEHDAAVSYDCAAIQLFGPFASLNMRKAG